MNVKKYKYSFKQQIDFTSRQNQTVTKHLTNDNKKTHQTIYFHTITFKACKNKTVTGSLSALYSGILKLTSNEELIVFEKMVSCGLK